MREKLQACLGKFAKYHACSNKKNRMGKLNVKKKSERERSFGCKWPIGLMVCATKDLLKIVLYPEPSCLAC